MTTFYSLPSFDSTKLFRDGIELVVNMVNKDRVIPLLQHGEIVDVHGHVLVITVSRTGKYSFIVQNTIGTTNSTVDVWSTNDNNGHKSEIAVVLDICSWTYGYWDRIRMVLTIGSSILIFTMYSYITMQS